MNNLPEVASPETKKRILTLQLLVTDALKHSKERDPLVMMNALLHLAVIGAVFEKVPLETLIAVTTHHYETSRAQPETFKP
jgi:hypothetical protein